MFKGEADNTSELASECVLSAFLKSPVSNMNNPFLKSLRHNIETILESDLWGEVKPSSMHAAEYFSQAIGDLHRCLGNLDRMERVEGEGMINDN